MCFIGYDPQKTPKLITVEASQAQIREWVMSLHEAIHCMNRHSVLKATIDNLRDLRVRLYDLTRQDFHAHWLDQEIGE